MALPNNLKYSKEHEWVRVDGDIAYIGITDYAQEALGDIVFVELPEIGDDFGQEDEFGSVESVKSVSELYMPIGGEVTAINEELEDKPELLNEDPYEAGWIVQIKIADASELDTLLNAEEYANLIEEA